MDLPQQKEGKTQLDDINLDKKWLTDMLRDRIIQKKSKQFI